MDLRQKAVGLSTADVAHRLGSTPRIVRKFIKDSNNNSRAMKIKNQWHIPEHEVEKIKEWLKENGEGKFKIRDSGLMQVSFGLTGISAAIMALVPNEPASAKPIMYWVTLIVSLSSLYASLWILGEYVEDVEGVKVQKWEESPFGWGHIHVLFASSELGPYKLLAVTSTFLVIAIIGASFFLVRA